MRRRTDEARPPHRAAAGRPVRRRSCARGGARVSRSASPGKLGARRACAAEARARQSPAHPGRAQLTRATHATLRTTWCARRAADGAQRAPDRAASTGPARRRARRPESCRGDALGADLLNGVGAPRVVSKAPCARGEQRSTSARRLETPPSPVRNAVCRASRLVAHGGLCLGRRKTETPPLASRGRLGGRARSVRAWGGRGARSDRPPRTSNSAGSPHDGAQAAREREDGERRRGSHRGLRYPTSRINWEWVGGGHVPCAGRSQQRAVFTAGKGERVVRQPSSNQTTHTHSTQFVSRSGPKGYSRFHFPASHFSQHASQYTSSLQG